jgi:hypothetical protein
MEQPIVFQMEDHFNEVPATKEDVLLGYAKFVGEIILVDKETGAFI